MNKRVLCLFTVALVLIVSVTPILGEGRNQLQTKARIFIEIAEKAKSIAVELIERARASGEDTASREALVNEGDTLLSKAKEAYGKEEYDSAAADARLAQSKYRDALKGLGPLMEGNVKERLTEAIQRARARIIRVREAISSSTEVREALREEALKKLDQTEQMLSEAESILRSGVQNVSEAARKLAQAEKTLSEAFTILRKVSQGPNKHRVEVHLRKLEQEILRLKVGVERLERRGVKAELLSELRNLLEMAEDLVRSAKVKVDSGDLAGALADMKEVDIIMRRALNLAKGPNPR
ncbi:MAG: hypothetical protein ACUVTM_07145 [Candidatus Bathyarchaeia archaeon]